MKWSDLLIGFGIGLIAGALLVRDHVDGFSEQYTTKHEVQAPNAQVIKHGYRCVADEQCMKLAEAIYHESRGESIKGQIAVAQVIMNRVNDPKFPNTVKEVIEQPKQFSYL